MTNEQAIVFLETRIKQGRIDLDNMPFNRQLYLGKEYYKLPKKVLSQYQYLLSLEIALDNLIGGK